MHIRRVVGNGIVASDSVLSVRRRGRREQTVGARHLLWCIIGSAVYAHVSLAIVHILDLSFVGKSYTVRRNVENLAVPSMTVRSTGRKLVRYMHHVPVVLDRVRLVVLTLSIPIVLVP